MYSRLRIVGWNTHGNLALKIVQPLFVEMIEANDVIILLETWLRPGQDMSLPLPHGYVIIARSRPGRGMRRPFGGAAVIIKSSIPCRVLEDLSGPDLIALELDQLYILGSYLLPATSDWLSWTDVDPKIRLREAFAWCSANRSKAVAGIGDLNSRIGNDAPPSSALKRWSSDDKPTNTRGTWLLNTCEDNRLEILNGTHVEVSSPGAYTSFQPNGNAVVDYALFSRDFMSMVQSQSLQIFRAEDWSDHAILSLTVIMPTATPDPLPRPMRISVPCMPRVCMPPTGLDLLVQETVSASKTDEESTQALYGSVLHTSQKRVTVHIASMCHHAGKNHARAAFGLHWGIGNPYNVGWRIAGRQNDGRATLLGIIAEGDSQTYYGTVGYGG
ncbi:hypothetical protein B0H15DRAFT_509146 [Mycena belliarum]|uniref:Endonuclease/exonuclease/phosphatase domain-containing protein n=1 Tax=Mycena belliarum TaxID=1033014 RepID=A0AAD6UF08_9AGAR|nr:hypothetical protein B0H15DRAFT_509146 [Mycena belliae]